MIYSREVIQSILTHAETASADFDKAKDRLRRTLDKVPSGNVTARAMKMANSNFDRKETAYNNAMSDLAAVVVTLPSTYFSN